MNHSLIRTSPKGQLFVGTCVNCHKQNLTFKDLNEECENFENRTQDETLLKILNDVKD